MFTRTVRHAVTMPSRGASVACVYQPVQMPDRQKAEEYELLAPSGVLKPALILVMTIKGRPDRERERS